jgi:hypothetical protein
MAKYLLIQSRDPIAAGTPDYDVAAGLAREGNEVILFLVQNGVGPAQSDVLTRLAAQGVSILADEFALRERGIGADRLAPGVKSAPLELIEQLADGHQAIWH